MLSRARLRSPRTFTHIHSTKGGTTNSLFWSHFENGQSVWDIPFTIMAAALPIFVPPAVMLTQKGQPLVVVEENCYYIKYVIEMEFMQNEFGVPFGVGYERCEVECTNRMCRARGSIRRNTITGVYDNFGLNAGHLHNDHCPWNLYGICFEFHKDMVFARLKDRTFHTVQESVDYARNAFRVFYPHMEIHFPVVKYFKSKGNKILKARFPPQPTLAGLPNTDIPPELTVTLREQLPFLLIKESFLHPPDATYPEGRVETIIVYSTLDRFQALLSDTEVFSDGTFKTRPPPFYQLYIIHSMIGLRMRPSIFALLSRKTEIMYDFFFGHLQAKAELLGYPIRWEVFRCDYEIAVMNAITTLLPWVRVIGCFFHFCSAVYRKMMELGLSVAYRDPHTWVKACGKRCMALAFLPPDLIAPTFQQVREWYYTKPEPRVNMEEFFAYIEQWWVLEGVAPRAVWSIHTIDGRRTTNDLEGYNSYLNTSFGVTKNLWKFLEKLRAEEVKVRLDIQRCMDGQQPITTPKYDRINTRLTQYKVAFGRGQLTPFMYVSAVSKLTPH